MSEPWTRTLDLDGLPRESPAVAWASAAPDADLPRLRPWRRAVGPAWAGAGGEAISARNLGVRLPLTVAAWNARTGGGALRAFWRRLEDEAGGPGRPVAALLQEVFSAGLHVPAGAVAEQEAQRWAWAERIADRPAVEPRTDIVSFAREEGLSLVYVPSMRNGRGDLGGRVDAGPAVAVSEDRGNAIVANVPLSSPTAMELPFERQRRVAVAARATLGPVVVGLCSVHLDNRAPWRRAWRSLGRARARQMAALLQTLSSFHPFRIAGSPEAALADALVLAGDFNTWVRGCREPAYKLARQRFPLPSAPDARPTHHFEVGGLLRHSDHLLCATLPGWQAGCRRLDDAFGSDHYPLVAKLAPG